MLPEMQRHGCTHSSRKEKIMKNKRKYGPGLFAGLLLICILQIYTVYAAASPSLSASADAATVTEGSYVNISVNLNGNPSISTLGAALTYDSSVLKYDSSSWSGGFSGSDMQMASDTGSEVNLSVVCDNSYSADGTVVTVRFQAVQNTSSIPVTLSLRDMADADLSAVSNCRVSSQVRVPETAGKKNAAADNKDDMVQLKAPETDIGSTESESGSDEQMAVSVADTGTDHVQSGLNTSAGNTLEASQTAGCGVQSTSVQNAQAAPASNTGSAKPDQNYKTGAGLGNDIFLIIAAVCGILTLILMVKKRREEK